MTDKIICKVYFEELNSKAAYLISFSDAILSKKIYSKDADSWLRFK